MSDEVDKAVALARLALKSQASVMPELSNDELETILEDHKRAQRWVAGATVQTGTRIIPATPNGRVYKVINGGLFGNTELFTSESFPSQITDGGVVLEDAGYGFDNIYDIDAAIITAWETKAAKASRLMATGGMNMGKIFENCLKMVEVYQTALVA